MTDRVVLVVGNDEAVITALRSELGDQPVELASAPDAAAAVQLLKLRHYCGMVLDLSGEGPRALEALRQIGSGRVDVPTVIISHRLPADLRDLLDDETVKLVLPRPADSKLLAAIVLGLCGLSR